MTLRVGSRVRHLGTSKIRIVSGVRVEQGRVVTVHFSQVIKKQNGRTFFWAEASKVKELS